MKSLFFVILFLLSGNIVFAACGYVSYQIDVPGPGNSTSDPSETPASGKLPDFITSKVTMGNKSGNKEKYTWKINETAYVHDYIDNIGTADWEGKAKKIKVPFYLSKGTKEDNHSEWVRVSRQEIKKENLKVKKKPKHEYIKFKLQDYANDGTIMPGRTYNFVVCADRPKDENNGDGDVKEKHKSNNCSTEAVFYVDYGPARNVDLMADNLALTGGRTQLQAGEKYGLQLEVSNIGTEQPWNGFLTSYEIKGPSTGGAWQKIGEDTSKASSLYPGAIHFEAMDGDDEVAAPMTGGDYLFRACTDYTQAVPETDESNNCTEELAVYVVPPPMPDLITEGLQLTHSRTSLIAGELYGLTVNVRNIGDVAPSSYSRTKYEIKGPGTNNQWQFITDDGTKAEHLEPGGTHWEEIDDDFGAHIPAVPGTYTARACADYQGAVPESDEGNNCSEMDFEVEDIPADAPRIVITNPNSDDDWRSSGTDHDFRWDYFDFPEAGHVRIEYSLDGGATWLLVTDETSNDGRKYWRDMCDYHTVDTHHAFVRITSVEYPYVYDISDEFSIDHAKECE
ncbi:MAG: CARDB domain-containing protein [Candidatus Electrothrix scaldis]|nr:MAG: CARDB domain-containing protein [Candidatus Electrothrix sp. GW3-3]